VTEAVSLKRPSSVLWFNYLMSLKDVFNIFLFPAIFFYIYKYCRKLNAEFNKLIKTVKVTMLVFLIK